jgi:alkylation response protein AidB-like acyl-CoA dehydrogenase
MNFDYTADQVYLKEEARRFLENRCPLTVVRQVLDAPDRGGDPALWAAIVEQGWLGAAVPEAYGGLGLGHVELCAIFEELGRALAPVPFASSILLIEALLLAGTEEQKQAFIPALIAGERVGAIALTEGAGPAVPATAAARFSDGQVHGVKTPVIDGGMADLLLVLVSGAQGPVLALADLRAGGVERTALSLIDPTRGAVEMNLAGVPARPLGAEGEGVALAKAILDRAAVFAAFEQIGGADRVLERTCAYALERRVFGRPLGANQAIKHKLADFYIRNQLARSNAYYAAWALGHSAEALPAAAAAARIAGCEAYWLASKESIQIHGGIGVTWEEDSHLFYRRSVSLSVVAGAPRYWRDRLSAALIAQH